MDRFGEMLIEIIEKELSFPLIAGELISRRLKDVGISLTDKQMRRLRKKLKRPRLDSLKIPLASKQIYAAGHDLEDFENSFVLDISDADAEVEEIYSSFIRKLDDAIPELTLASAKSIFDALVEKTSSELNRHDRDRSQFTKRHLNCWGTAINTLEIFLRIAFELGSDFSRERGSAEDEISPLVIDVLVRLHARACLVSNEILVLLKAGLPDGAHARWRCLHEILVVALFIRKHGHEVAERYVLHDSIESYKAATLDRKYSATLGMESITEEEFTEVEEIYDELVARFGKPYKKDYGWAAEILAPHAPTFRNIEKSIGQDHLRPFYKLASHNIHPNPKGIFFKMGLNRETDDFLLAGPSSFGLADPGHLTAISMMQLTDMILKIAPTFDRLIQCQVLRLFEGKIGDEFIKVHRSLESEPGSG